MRVLLLMYCSVGNHPSLRGHTQAPIWEKERVRGRERLSLSLSVSLSLSLPNTCCLTLSPSLPSPPVHLSL